LNCFFDSSALVKRYVAESGTAAVLKIVREAEVCIASRLAWLEITSAVARASSAGTLSDASAVLRALDDDFCTLIAILEVSPPLLADARRLTLKHTLSAADAIQLSSVLVARTLHGAGTMLISSDRELNTAAAEEGIAVLDPRDADRA
jgi:predicted nucleic acid-binding protein